MGALDFMAQNGPTMGGGGELPPPGMMAPAAAPAPFTPPPGFQPRPLKSPDEDLAKYDKLADPHTGDALLRQHYRDLKTACLDNREILESDWMRKILYLRSRQWVKRPTGDARGGWTDKRLASWIPMPVTNKLKEGVLAIRSMLAAIDPDAIARPNGQDPNNVLTAQTSDEIQSSIKEEHEISERFWDADWWAAALGTVYLHVFHDPDDSSHKEWIDYLQCTQCQTIQHPLDFEDLQNHCYVCGGQQVVPASTPDNKVGEYAIRGKGKTEVVSEFELLYPTLYQSWEDVDRLIRLRWRPKWYYAGKPYAATLKYQATPGERTMQLYRSLALMTDMPLSANLGSTPGETTGTLEAEVWQKPNAEYPLGLWYRIIDNGDGQQIIIRDAERAVQPGPIPYQAPEPNPVTIWPWVYYPFERVGGRVHGDSALDGAINKQDQLNRNDSMIELTMQRMANPMWLEPKGAEVERFTGAPGLIARYSVIGGAPNAKPERIGGEQPVPASFELRKQHIDDIESAMGTHDVLKGERPPSVEAFSALQLLKEMSQGRFTSVFKTRGKAYRDWYKIALELERSYGPSQRVRAVMGPNRSWTFRKFERANLQGDVSIIIEDGTNVPKTTLGKRAAFEHARQAGIFNPQDPEQLHAGAQILGVPEIIPGIDANVRAAQQEQEQYEEWVQGGRQPVPMRPGSQIDPTPLATVLPWENSQVHIQQHDLWANSDRIKRLIQKDPMVAMEIAAHRQKHQQQLMLLQAQQAGATGAGGPDGADGTAPQTDGSAPGERGTGAGGAMAASNQESGATDTLPTSRKSGSPAGASA